MKKIFFMLLAATALLSSCSSDNDIINNGGNDTPSTKKHTVNFDIKSTGFNVDKTPMRSLTDSNTFIQIVAYKESGEVYSDTIIKPEQISNIISETGSFPFSVELPNGNYHLAFMQRSYLRGGMHDISPEKIKLKPENFYTDTYGGGYISYIVSLASDANVNDYYQTIDISVSNTSQNTIEKIELEPMWSRVNISIDDFTPPTGCKFIAIDLAPAYIKYNLSDKLAPYDLGTHRFGSNGDDGFTLVKPSVNNGTAGIQLNVSKTAIENNNMKLIIKFYKDSNHTLMMTSEIDLKTQVENGLNYKIKGKYSDILPNSGSHSLNLTYAPFNEDKPIDLPF